MLTPQQLLITTTNKPTPTTRENLIIMPITSFTTTPTRNYITAPNDNCKKIVIGDLVKISTNRLTAIPIKHIQKHLI